MQLANEIMKSASVQKHKDIHVIDARYQGLGMKEMTPLTQNGAEFSEISNYLTKSVGGTHNISYKVQDVFRIERNGEFDRLDKSAYAKLGAKSDRRLLWVSSPSQQKTAQFLSELWVLFSTKRFWANRSLAWVPCFELWRHPQSRSSNRSTRSPCLRLHVR